MSSCDRGDVGRRWTIAVARRHHRAHRTMHARQRRRRGERRQQIDGARRTQQLDRETFVASATRPLGLERRASCSCSRDPPCCPTSESCRPTPDARASSSPTPAPPPSPAPSSGPIRRPPRSVRNGGRPLNAGLTSRSMRRSLIVASCVSGDGEQVGGDGRPARHGNCRPTRSRRSRRRPWGCRSTRWLRSRPTCADEAERIAHRAVHLRRAALRVGVLHPPAVGVRRVDGASGQQPRRCWRPRRPGPDAAAPRESAPRTAGSTLAARRSTARATTSAARASRSAWRSASASTAIDACVPLMSASPSFGPSRTGCQPGASSASAPGTRGRSRSTPRLRR